MKKQFIKHFVFFTLLVVFLFISFRKTSFATYESKISEATYCCKGGRYIGACNDCKEGTGSCSDHVCLPDESEECNINCTSA